MVKPRSAAMAFVALLLFAPPAAAEENPEPAPAPPGGGGGGGCGDASNCTSGGPGGNSTAPPASPQPQPAPQPSGIPQAVENTVASVRVGGSCDLVRPTGDRPSVSVNPVLGLVTVNPGCVLRWIRTVHSQPLASPDSLRP